jgi:hypothetical protein
MSAGKQGDDRLACFVCNMNLSGLTITRVILWLMAIAIVSFVIGFGILAISGELPSGSGNKASPFRHPAMLVPNTTTIMLDGASTGSVRITMGAGELSVHGGAPDTALMEATVFSKSAEWQPELEESVNGSQKSVFMTEKGHKGKEWFAVHSPNTWEILLNDRLPLNLEVNVGAGDSRLDLGSLNLASLIVNNGAGDTEIDLGRYRGGRFNAEIHNGVGDLTVRLPKSSNSRIAVHSGVGDVTSTGFEQRDEYYITPGYNPSLPVNDILLKQGVGSIILEAV